MRTAVWVAAACAAWGCRKGHPPTILPTAESPSVVSTAEQDALWKLAPAGARWGIVVSGRVVAMTEAAWLGFRELLAASPEAVETERKLAQGLQRVLGHTRSPRLAELGLSAERGAAMFERPDGGFVLILPVADRAKWAATSNSTRRGDTDTIKNLTCKPVGERYVCVSPASLFDELGKSDLPANLAVAGARGEIEAAGEIEGVSGAVVAQLARGTVTLRGTVDGIPPVVTAALGTRARPQATDGAAGFAFADVRPLLDAILDRRPDLAGLTSLIAGPLHFRAAPGELSFDLRVPVHDAPRIKDALEHCDTQMPTLGATVVRGACRGTATFGLPMTLEARVVGTVVHIARIGVVPGSVVRPGPVGTELARGEWSAVGYGRGSLLAEALPWSDLELDRDNDGLLLVRLLGLINELGLGIRLDGTKVSFVATVRTAWSNPDDVVRKLLAIDPRDVVSGAAVERAKQIAAASPGAPFAGDLRGGIGGLIAASLPIATYAAIAVQLAKAEPPTTMPPPP